MPGDLHMAKPECHETLEQGSRLDRLPRPQHHQQRLVAQMLEEIAFREKKPLAALLAADGLGSLLAGEMPQKKFLAALHGLRYPACELREQEWRAWQKKAVADGGLALAHAPFFASEEVRVTLTVKNRGQAERLLAGLKKIL